MALVDIQLIYCIVKIENPDSDAEEEFFDSAPVYNESDSFYTMNLSRPLLKAIEELNFVHPTPIQVILFHRCIVSHLKIISL